MYNHQGEVRQCNEGKYEFHFTEDEEKDLITLELQVPRFLTTELIDVDLNPEYVRIDIKGKITQLRFPEEIIVEKSQVQRSQTTGFLVLTCPRVRQNYRNTEEAKAIRDEKEKKQRLDALEKVRVKKEEEKKRKEEEDEKRRKKQLEEEKKKSEAADFIIRESKDTKGSKKKDEEQEEFVPDFDLSELPPLD